MRKRTLATLASLGVVAAAGGVGGLALAAGANGKPTVILRGAFSAQGAQFVGSGGYTETHTGVGTYKVTFPAGTFMKKTTVCGFVPQAQTVPVANGQNVHIDYYLALGDGSGEFDIVTTNAAGAPEDAPWDFVAVS